MSAADELCPLDSRRGDTEVFVKRLAIIVTVVCLLGHLNTLRGVRTPFQALLNLYLTIFNPLHPISSFCLDIVLALYKALWADRWPEESFYRTLAADQGRSRSWRYYTHAALGVHAGDDSVTMPLLYFQSSTVKMAQPGGRPPNGGLRRTGTFFVLGVTTIQCAATLVLGIRREIHGGATRLDRQAYLFAASGLVVLLHTAVLQAMPAKYSDGCEQHTVAIMRMEIFVYGFPGLLAAFFAGDGSLASEPMILAYAVVFCLHLAMFKVEYEDITSDKVSWKMMWTDPMGLIVQAGFLFIVGQLVCAGVVVGLITGFYYKPSSDHFTDPSGSPVPTDVPCPFLWKDPLADLLWAF